jgi:hypothetical protein
VESLEKLVEDGEGEFRNEVKISERTHNNNLVCLIGFCSEGSNRLLVYEFMKNSSLGDLIFKAKRRRSLRVRTDIPLGVANDQDHSL